MKGSLAESEGGPKPAATVGARAVRLGQLVTSRAGRDTGRAYLVVGVRPDGWLLVADGRYRRVGRPKAKNPRHLWVHDRVAAAVGERLERGDPVTDGEISQALSALVEADPA